VEVGAEAFSYGEVELPLLQILVVVAIIQMKTLNTDVEKGFMWTVFDHEWIDPKAETNLGYGKIESIYWLDYNILPSVEREAD